MAIIGGLNMVRDGLVLYLDAANTKSYPTTGTTWTDLSGNGKNGTLVNDPTYSPLNNGSIVFDGVNDVVTSPLNTLSPNTTWAVWVKRTQSINDYNMMMGMYLPYFAFRSNGSIHFSNSIGGSQKSLVINANLVNDIWYYMSFVSLFSDGSTTMLIYLNDGLLSQQTYLGQQPTTTIVNFRLGGWNTDFSFQFKGNISNLKIYNRSLTAEEVQQNYNATKGRFGLS